MHVPDQEFCLLPTMFWAIEVFSPSPGMIAQQRVAALPQPLVAMM